MRLAVYSNKQEILILLRSRDTPFFWLITQNIRPSKCILSFCVFSFDEEEKGDKDKTQKKKKQKITKSEKKRIQERSKMRRRIKGKQQNKREKTNRKRKEKKDLPAEPRNDQ